MENLCGCLQVGEEDAGGLENVENIRDILGEMSHFMVRKCDLIKISAGVLKLRDLLICRVGQNRVSAPYITVRMYGDFPIKNTVCTPYIPINAWFWSTLLTRKPKLSIILSIRTVRTRDVESLALILLYELLVCKQDMI
jgi:hypothetical protein